MSTKLRWEKSLNFGIDELDAEHQALVALVNELEDRAAGPAEAVAEVLRRLVMTVDGHIEHENQLLTQLGYDHSDDHADADRKFLRMFQDLEQVFHEQGSFGPETRDFIRHLILQHIIKTDRPLRDFFRERLHLKPDENPYIHWLDSFAMGWTPIDEDHRIFVDMVNQLKDALDSGADQAVVVGILTAFVEHAEEHFRREESLLADLGYPGTERHAHEHATLNRSIAQTCAAIRSGERSFGADELLVLIKEWIIRHILFVDMKVKSFLDEQVHRRPSA